MSTISQVLVPSPPPLVAAQRPPRPPLRPVSVADRVARLFPPLACVRGYRYFLRKRVDFVNESESAIDADVKGKRTLRVVLRVHGGRLSSACTCSAKILGPAACRHVWATLLEIDRRGAFASLRANERALTLGVIEVATAKAKAEAKAKAKAPRAPRAPRAPKTGGAAS